MNYATLTCKIFVNIFALVYLYYYNYNIIIINCFFFIILECLGLPPIKKVFYREHLSVANMDEEEVEKFR